ncbi:NUDIX domain-containing protein [Oceanobacillus sp. 1P07AA]|uniref:NUDIX domain-containing protein n=1 Tax=Oceanobacillus sp. 1P07AA TaxID=3132293 RepID=UPI0039A40DB9
MPKFDQEQQEFLQSYNTNRHITPDGYTSDIAVFTIVSNTVSENASKRKVLPKKLLKLLLIRRVEIDKHGNPNVEGGKWALPGGFVDAKHQETAHESAIRELNEETGVDQVYLKHFGVYDAWGRDPRGWIISNAHYAIVPEGKLTNRKAADDAAEVKLFSIEEVLELSLAFDHRQIIEDALRWIERDMLNTDIAKNFLLSEFTLSELQGVLLTVSNHPKIANKSVFFTKAPKLPFLEKVVDENGNWKKTERNSYRPSQLYRFTNQVVVPSIWE